MPLYSMNTNTIRQHQRDRAGHHQPGTHTKADEADPNTITTASDSALVKPPTACFTTTAWSDTV